MEKIVIACDSFKGSLSSAEANAACARGLRERFTEVEIVEVSVADGGEGTGEALAATFDARPLTINVCDPIGRAVDARFFLSADRRTAIIDTAAASGLTLLSAGERNPMHTSTFGTGQQIAAAIDMGCRHIVLGLGGSATNDCGCGLLSALGFRFLDRHGTPLHGGADILPQIVSIDSSHRMQGLDRVSFTLYTDVDNPLYGPDGAAYTFGPQKGADALMCHALDEGMRCFASVLRVCGFDDTSAEAGAGAAGGLGAGLSAILRADIRMGAPAILEAIDFENTILDASLVITGEGRIDASTLHGKTPFSVMQQARRLGIPTVAIGGSVADADALVEAGFKQIISAMPAGMSLREAMMPAKAADNLRQAAKKVAY
ncbi:MAG: glycerate kinase [Muribaculaceae bacterium]|nr:glycerate kinase [Muribaculaceae bacterium]